MRRLVLCSDGTGNSSAKAQKTNVWRIFQAIDQTAPDQLAKYDDGVGTSSNKYLAALGGAFGYGLKRNVIDLYKFVCRNWRAGDEIYGFGFSRGAFTIRVVVALIESQGLVEGRSESELHAHALAAYRRYREARYWPRWSPLVWLGRRLRDLMTLPSTLAGRRHIEQLPLERRAVPIRFLGLWDTVAAYGMPVDELKWGISLLIWPMAPVDHHLHPRVQRACHALSLDDQRQTFHPILFDETHEAKLVAEKKVLPGRLTQVWFAGVHSNVGGGYPEDQQSYVTLDWMISQALDAGLRLDAGAAGEVAQDKSAFARLYDSRQGLASYYRYSPRQVGMGRDTAGRPIRAIVHGSVVMRMAAGSDAYAPISLPASFDVLAPDGTLLPMSGFPAGPLVLPLSTTAIAKIPTRTADLKTAIAAMGEPQEELVEQIRDSVWWRRVAYFACLAFTLVLVAFPFAAKFYALVVDAMIGWLGPDLRSDASTGATWLDAVLKGLILPWSGVLESLAPPWAASWLRAFGAQPFEMLLAVLLVAVPFQAGSFLERRIHDRAWFAWHADRRQDYIDWVRESARSSTLKAAVLLVIALLLVAVELRTHWRPELAVLLRLLALVLAPVLAWRVGIMQRLKKLTAKVVPTTPTLRAARFIRNDRFVGGVVHVLACWVIPLAFAIALLLGVLGATSHLVARALDSAGLFCEPSGEPIDVGEGPAFATRRFDTRAMCWATGIRVKKGVRYEFVMNASNSPPWKDLSTPSSVAGVSQLSALHALAMPIKRSWSVDYFVPMLRIGRLGNDEYALAPASTASGGGIAKLAFIPPRDDELFVYVSDAVAMVPTKTSFFYDNNCGWASISVRRAAPDTPPASAIETESPPPPPSPGKEEQCHEPAAR